MLVRTALFLIGVLFVAVPATAQTIFEWPDTAVDVSKYTTLEECRAAVARAYNIASAREYQETRIWMDTVRSSDVEFQKPIHHEVGETARRCLGAFADPTTAPLDDFRYLITMYLLAGYSDRAHTLAERRLAAASDTSRQYAAVLDTLLHIYSASLPGTQPMWDVNMSPSLRTLRRLDLIDSLLLNHVPRVPKRLTRIGLFHTAVTAYGRENRREGHKDKAHADSLAARVVAMVDSLTPAERRELWESAPRMGDGEEQADRLAARYESAMHDFYDSLRISTEKFVRAKRNAWTRATGMPPETYGLGEPIGEKAPPIEADYWLGCKGECGVRPVPGRINLIVRIFRNECAGVPTEPTSLGPPFDICARRLIPVRRLMERYPEVAVTIVARTGGRFLYLKEGVTPEEEAKLTRQWLDWYGIDAPVAVTATEYWRISEYDRRRVNRPDPNDENYSFGKSTPARRPGIATMLIDPDGLIVRVREENRSSEVEYSELIDVLLEREKAKR